MSVNQNDIIYFLITDRFYGRPNPGTGDFDSNNPRAFHGGNIEGIIDKIPYLKKLGITALWITPVYLQIPALYDGESGSAVQGFHGYWPLDFNSMDPHFYINDGSYPAGSKLYLKNLVDRLHENGIKLILDMVVNHTGYNHPGAFDGPENPTPIRSNWYNQRGLSCSDNTIEGELAALPDMNLDNPDVADYHIETIISWIRETGIDAIRMDTVKHVERIFWNYYKTQVKGKFPDVDLLGEVLEFDADAISQYQQHFAFDNLFDFPMQDAICKTFIWDVSLKIFVSPYNSGSGILEKDSYYTNQNKMVTLLDNHDLSARVMSWAVKKVGGPQNKDLAARLVKLALTFMFTIRGIPQIYYGTELGLEGEGDPWNRMDFSWNILDSNYDVKPEFALEKEIFEHCRNLITLRKGNAVLSCGNFVCLYVDDFIIAFLRYIDDEAIISVFHNGWLPMPRNLTITTGANSAIPTRIKNLLENGKLRCLLTGRSIDIMNGEFSIRMDPKSALVLGLNK